MRKFMKIIYLILLLFTFSACNKYLDIVPDNIPTLDYAFQLRRQAEKFLFTCYAYVPYGTKGSTYNIVDDPAFSASDEWWYPELVVPTCIVANIFRGNQNVAEPYGNNWEGRNRGVHLYNAIRECNILLENVDRVPDMEEDEKIRWKAEAKFLKAYYLFVLVRMYGPVILPRTNLPVSANTEEVKRAREPVDSCFSYIVQLMDEAYPDLPDEIENKIMEEGRITKSIDLAVKAYVMVTAASPLFNGNPDYKNFTNLDGTHLFPANVDNSKWVKAAEACKEAIDFCEAHGYKLYHYTQSSSDFHQLSDTTKTKLSIRNAMTSKWNSEVIWGVTTRVVGHTQALCFPRGLDPSKLSNSGVLGYCAPPLKIVNMFYSNHGVPITEDKTWDYAGRFKLQKADSSNRYNIQLGYTTAKLNFNREPRFYADLGFDGGLWFGQGKNDDNDQWVVMCKKGQAASAINPRNYSTTGYFTKKLVHINSVLGTGNTFTDRDYPWPLMTMDNLYLLYAEALNEAQGPGPEVYNYLDKIRERAGIPGIEESWNKYSKYPNKYKTREGLREIIHRERNIELVFEGSRFWDLRRWKEMIDEFNKPVTGWDIDQSEPERYYREVVLYTPTFTPKDYFWPLSEKVLTHNDKIVQNPGWGY